MKFPVDKCKCGLDLTTAEPVYVWAVSKEEVTGNCPSCGQPYRMVVEPPVETEAVAKPEPKAKKAEGAKPKAKPMAS